MGLLDQLINMRVLVTVGDNDKPKMTCVKAISPNGLYVFLDDVLSGSQSFSWRKIADVKVLDVISQQIDIRETQSTLFKRLASLLRI
jgi:hypothetical protein